MLLEAIIQSSLYLSEQESIRQHVERLLNSRIIPKLYPVQYPALKTTVLNYGLPDFSHEFFADSLGQVKLCEAVEKVILLFEPRIKDVKALPLNDQHANGALSIVISGELISDAALLFESQFNLLNLSITVESRSS